MNHRGSRNDSGHSRRNDSGHNTRDTGNNGSSSSGSSRMSRFRGQEPDLASHTEQGVEVSNNRLPQQQPRVHMNSVSHAGVVSTRLPTKTGSETSSSQHNNTTTLNREDLPEQQQQQQQQRKAKPQRTSVGTLNPPTEELSRIPYEDYVHPSYSNDGGGNWDHQRRPPGTSPDALLDISDRVAERMEGSYRMFERSTTEFSRHDSMTMSRPSSQSVVSDMSFGDKPYRSLPMISMVQDSGSILPHLNTSHKSVCSLTHGSKRMAEKREQLLKTGSILYSDPKKVEEEELVFKRWGGRKDYSSNSSTRKVQRKKGIAKLQKKREKARVRMQQEEQQHEPMKMGRKSGFHDLWGLVRQDTLEYDQLIKEDRDREKVASYCEEPFWKIIFHFKGTVLKVIIEDILFWLTLATFVSIRIRFRLEPASEDLNEVNYETLSDNLVYVGGFLTFFLVFYVNQNHHRYFQLHEDSMTLMGRVEDMATLAKAVLPMERARRITRFMNAAHVAMYTGLSSNYSKHNLFDPLEARFALLTDEELYRIANEIDVDQSGSKASFEMITWIMCDIRDAQINSFIDTNEAVQMRELLLDFRSTIAKVFVTTTLPIPFFYVHFLSMLTAVYLPLFAVVVAYETGRVSDSSNVWVGEIVSCLVVFLQALFVIGLRILGQQLSDPYGGDLIDLQIARYVNMVLNGSNQILAAKRLPQPSVETELRLQLQMSSLGQAFEYDTDDEYIVQH